MQRRFARDQRSTAAEEESGRRQCKSGVHDEEKWKPGSATLARGMGKSACAIKFCKIISDRGLQFVSRRFLHWWLTLRLALQRRRWRVTSANGAGGSAQNPAARSAGGTQKAALALAGRFHSADFWRLRASVAAGGEVWRRCQAGRQLAGASQ